MWLMRIMGGGTEPIGEVWYTGTIDLNAECVTEEVVAYRGVELSPTEIANAEALWDSPNGYDISVNDVSLSLIVDYDYMKAWAVGESSLSYEMPLFSVARGEETEKLVAVGVPCDWTGDVKIYVTKK